MHVPIENWTSTLARTQFENLGVFTLQHMAQVQIL